MDEDFIKKLPAGVPMSEHLEKKAQLYARVRHFGVFYYIPIDRKLKRILGITEKKGEVIVPSNSRYDILESFQNLVGAVYLQIRDTVGAEISDDLSEKIEKGLREIFEKNISMEVNSRLNNKLKIEDKSV